MIILGIVIVIIQSEYQVTLLHQLNENAKTWQLLFASHVLFSVSLLTRCQIFSGLVFQSATARYSEIVLSNDYSAHERASSVGRTFAVASSLLYTLLMQAIGQLAATVFQSALTFSMSFVKVHTFVEAGGLHPHSGACDSVINAEGFDSLLAYLSTALAYVILPAAFYEVAKVVCPCLDKTSQADAKQLLYYGTSIRRRSPSSVASPRFSNKPSADEKEKHEEEEEEEGGGGVDVEADGSRAQAAPRRLTEPDTDSDSSDDGGVGPLGQATLCARDGCNKQAKYNAKGKKRPLWCQTHAPRNENSVNVVDDICAYHDCSEVARYNAQTLRTGRYCISHKLVGMVNVAEREEGWIVRYKDAFFFYLRLPSTMLAPDLILATVSARLPTTLPVNAKSLFKRKKKEKEELYVEFRESQASLRRGGGAGGTMERRGTSGLPSRQHRLRRLVSSMLKHLKEEAVVPLAKFPISRVEEMKWEETKLNLALPSYWTLLRHEYRELCDLAFGPSMLQGFATLSLVEFLAMLLLGCTQIGHVATSHGRIACVQIFKRYWTFLQVCCGYWSRKTYEAYEVEEVVRKYRLWAEGNVELNRKNDTYAKALSALVTTRAILMQVTPYLTLFSMGAISISSCPMLIWGDDTNASMGQRRKQVWRGGKTPDEDRQPWQSNLFPWVVLNPLERAFGAEEEDKFKKRKWILRLRAVIIFITCSRIFTFALNAYKFGLCIYILYQPSLSGLLFATFFFFLPYAVCAGLTILITVGKKLNIRDPDKLLAPRKEERDIVLIGDEFSKLGKSHITFHHGFFCFSNRHSLEHIYATLLKERNRTELKKYKLESADKVILRGERAERKKVHILEFLLGEEFLSVRKEARNTREEWVMFDLDNAMGKRSSASFKSKRSSASFKSQRSQASGAYASAFSWGPRKQQQGLDLSELGSQTPEADARERATHIMDVQLEKETVRRVMEQYSEQDRAAGRVAGTTLWTRYLDKIYIDEKRKLQEEAYEEEDEQEEGEGFRGSTDAREAAVRGRCETRVNRKLLREGIVGEIIIAASRSQFAPSPLP